MKYELIIFDMDGTILDTLEDLKNTLNHTLTLWKMPTRSLDEVRSFVGNGIRKLIERAVPKETTEETIEKIFADFLAYYQLHCADSTKPYDGILELLMTLKQKGYKTAVVSNKANAAVQELCVQYFNNLFDCAVGEQAQVQKKPAPDMVEQVLHTLQVSPEKSVYVGDSEVDIATAVNSHLDAIIVEWGFRDKEFLKKEGAKTIVSTPSQILQLV